MSFAFGQYAVNTLLSAAPVLVVAVGLTLIFGVLDIPDFAQGALMIFSAYTVWYIAEQVHLGFTVGAILAVAAAGIVGSAYYYLLYREIQIHGGEEEYTSNFLIALGIYFIIQFGAFYLTGGISRYVSSPIPGGHQIFGAQITNLQLIVIGLATVSVLALHMFLNMTLTGKAIQAIDQSIIGAEATGIDIERISLVTFAIGSCFAGLGGVLLAPLGAISPTTGFIVIIEAFTAVILGGLGSVRGAVLAALVLAFVKNFSVAIDILPSQFQLMYVFILLYIGLVVKPEGIFGGSARGV